MKKINFLSLSVGLVVALGCQTTESPKNIDVIYPNSDARVQLTQNANKEVPPQKQTPSLVKPVAEETKIKAPAPKAVIPEATPSPTAKTVTPAAKSKTELAIVSASTEKTAPVKQPVPETKPVVTTEPVKVAKKEEIKAVAKVEPVDKSKKYTLRIISLPCHDYYSKIATKIADYLRKEKKIEFSSAHVSKNQQTKYWVVDVGRFESVENAEAKAFQKSIQELKYEGMYQFRDAFFVSR